MMYIANKPKLQPFAWVLRRVLTDTSMMSQLRSGALSVGAQDVYKRQVFNHRLKQQFGNLALQQ